jgi:hypothetical protein
MPIGGYRLAEPSHPVGRTRKAATRMGRTRHDGVLHRRSRASAGIRRPASDAAPEPAGVDTAKVVEYVGLIAAPATLVSALVYWLGFELVDARSAYFGIGTGVLGYSTTDYLVRGAEAGVVPLFVLFTAALVVIFLHAGVTVLRARAGDAAWLQRAAAASPSPASWCSSWD